ncbi:MAG: PP2C family serine/threonine-protein phosphatase [Candidatus Contendobacter sp.]|nr:PP2C family serine/threonine-protein phosphatase [Candidatus Contendobacter sp.]
MTDPNSPNWRTLGASVRGAAHHRAGLPNQDAIRVARANGELPLIVALADGHGSAKSFRSQHGARSAVAVALKVCRSLCEPDSLSRIKRWAEEQLPLELVRRWRERVDRSLARRPFTPAELDALDPASRRQVEAHPYLAYGSTLLAVVVTPAFILYLQLGDGDLLTVSTSGEVERPLAKDERLIANETTSLCSAKAWNEVRVGFQALAGSPPALILVATDGYANSFRDEASFQQVARDLREMIREEGLEPIRSNLKSWLNEASRQGSGDDITVGIIC